jgi:hypothetical protein
MFIPDTGSEFSIPDPNFCHPGSRVHFEDFKYLTPKNGFKLSEIWSGLFIPDPDPDFLAIPDTGSRGQKGTGSQSELFFYMTNVKRKTYVRRLQLTDKPRGLLVVCMSRERDVINLQLNKN